LLVAAAVGLAAQAQVVCFIMHRNHWHLVHTALQSAQAELRRLLMEQWALVAMLRNLVH
jgi:hypothetical protein